MTYPHLRLVEPHRTVDLAALPHGRYWSLSHDGEVGYWTQLDQEPVHSPYGCAQHAVDALAGRAMAVWHDPSDVPPAAGEPRLGRDLMEAGGLREDRGSEANERGLRAACWATAGLLVLAAFAWAALS